MEFKNLFKRVFTDRTIFVTGHTGFQGTWLSLWLKQMGANVIGYSIDIPTKPSFFEILNLKDDITDISGDVRDYDHLKSSINEFKPDMVFHLAAQSLVRPSYSDPLKTFQTNVMGTANLLNCFREKLPTKVCIVTTSDKCYENQEWDFAYRENDPMGGHDPYSASKGAAEIIISSFRKSFFDFKKTNSFELGISTIRAGNVIGGGDWANDRIIPDCIKALSSNKPITLRNPDSIRPWQYVLEPLSGILLLAMNMWHQPDYYEGPWNFGPSNNENSLSVKDLVNHIISIWGTGSMNFSNNKEPHEAHLLRLDSTKANKILGWRPTYSFKDMLAETVDWYKNYYQQDENMMKLSITQLEKFITKAQNLDIPWSKTIH